MGPRRTYFRAASPSAPAPSAEALTYPRGVDLVINAAYVLFLLSYLVRDILKLRVLSLIAGFLLIAAFSNPINLSAIVWNIVFSVINVVQIVVLAKERRPVRLAAEEHSLHQLAFRSLSPREFQKLARYATFRDLAADERVVSPGEEMRALMVVMRGELDVRANEERVATLRQGQFVGEMSFLSGKAPTVEVVAAREGRIASLESGRLKKLLEGSAELRAAVQSILGRDLVDKLASPAPRAWGVASPSSSDAGQDVTSRR